MRAHRHAKVPVALSVLALCALPATAAGAQPGPAAPPAAASTLPVIQPVLETPTAFDDAAGGDADADDPAIWVHPDRPARSLVLGALKNGGLAVYDLKGRLLQQIDVPAATTAATEEGRFNNVDLARGVRTGRGTVDLAVVSDRGRDRIRTYRIDPRGASAGAAALTDVTAPSAAPVFSADEAAVEDQRNAYGLAATVSKDGTGYVVTSRRNETRLAGLRLVPTADGRFTYTRTGTLDLPNSFRLPNGTAWTPCAEPGEFAQLEGMVIDAENGVLYAAQEDVGIWRISLASGRFGAKRLIDRVREYGVPATYDPVTEECAASGADPGFGGRNLTADAEGLTIATTGKRTGYLLASSQGDNTFAVYDRRGSNRYLGGFAIGDSTSGRTAVDGVQQSDGAAVVTAPLGKDFPAGLLVVHDGEETPAVLDGDGEPRTGTDFTYVDWREVLRSVPALTPRGGTPRS